MFCSYKNLNVTLQYRLTFFSVFHSVYLFSLYQLENILGAKHLIPKIVWQKRNLDQNLHICRETHSTFDVFGFHFFLASSA